MCVVRAMKRTLSLTAEVRIVAGGGGVMGVSAVVLPIVSAVVLVGECFGVFMRLWRIGSRVLGSSGVCSCGDVGRGVFIDHLDSERLTSPIEIQVDACSLN